MNWDKYRRPDGTIDLIEAYTCECIIGDFFGNGFEYLRYVEELQLIKSRQVAAIALATAVDISKRP